MRVCLWFTSTAKAFLWGQKRFQAFIFPTEFTADSKKFSLEEKNRKKVISSRIHNETNLNSFKSTYSRALLRSLLLFALISFYLVWLRISSSVCAREEFSALTLVLSFLQDRSERERMAESGKFLSHTHTKKVSVWHALLQFFFALVWVWFYSYWLVWKIKLARSP